MAGFTWLFSLCVLLFTSAVLSRHIHIGMLLPNGVEALDSSLGFKSSAGALTYSIDRVNEEGILPGTNYTVTWYFDQCDESLSIAYANRLYKHDKVDVIIGPTCTSAAMPAGIVAKFYNLPMFTWGPLAATEMEDRQRFPTTVMDVSTAWGVTLCLVAVFREFQWNEYVFFYSATTGSYSPFCALIQSSLEYIPLRTDVNMSLLYKRNLENATYDSIRTQLGNVKNTARVIVTCLDSTTSTRDFLLAATENNMLTDEYVYVFIVATRMGFGDPPFWEDTRNETDGKDAIVKKACEKVLVLDTQQTNASSPEFNDAVVGNMHKWPFYCDDCPKDGNASRSSASMADAFYIYANALNRTIEEVGEDGARNGTLIAQHSNGVYQGVSGKLVISNGGYKRPIFFLYALDSKGNQKHMATVNSDEAETNHFDAHYTDESVLWFHWGGMRPPSRPVCDFDGSGCPPSVWEVGYPYIIGLTVFAGVVVATMILLFFAIWRSRTREIKRLNSLWQIPFHMLIRQDQKSDIARSYRSIQSGISASTKSSIMVKKDTARTLYCFYNKEAVIARKIDYRVELSKEHESEFRFMRNVDHENLNKFLGICLESPKIKSLWRYCSRGSIADIIEQDSTTLDAFIATSLMRDICEGLFFIHNSSILKQHGCLTSSACLVSDRWQVKVQEYGLSAFKAVQARQKKDKSNLWVAPEILRSRENCIGSKPGDIYSFAIICSELISRRPAWNLGENELNLEQILYNVQRGRHPPYRPDMTDEGVHHNPRLIQLVRECWDESPERRPKIDAIRESLKAVTLNNASTNLMDYIFNLLESNASALEQEVDERMKELIAEKKKSDILLYRMLPRAVADKLKLGVTAEPELFEAVTVFFSDIVVNLLNELYTEFDSIIDQHDVYKVETIGDGLHCVSGLPLRNGDNHVREIAEMSFAFLRVLKQFKVPHAPDHQISIRVGMHTGPCVAGVVGMTAPRYCVFGETVNTAAKMESNGKPGKIHISATTHRYATSVLGNGRYYTESRGEVLIKGKGPMETFWLIPPEEIGLNLEADVVD